MNIYVATHSDWIMQMGPNAILGYACACRPDEPLKQQTHLRGNTKFMQLIEDAKSKGEKIIVLPRSHKHWNRIIPDARRLEALEIEFNDGRMDQLGKWGFWGCSSCGGAWRTNVQCGNRIFAIGLEQNSEDSDKKVPML